jgi:Zn-dependent peptidase ImmA (M78 family)
MRRITLVPKTVRWARKYRGVPEEEAAKALGNSIERLHLIESTGAPITAGEFRKLAKKYRLSEATLAMPEPPPVPDAPEDFRTLDGRDASLTTQTLEAISTAQERQLSLASIREAMGEPAPTLSYPKVMPSTDPSSVANRERQRLNFTLDVQRELGDAYAIFSDLRNRVEAQGVAVYVLRFRLQDCRGFSLGGAEILPAIVVNSTEHEWSARNFTLIHEYAHLLLHRPGISDERSGNRIERWCNAFAAEFLMPRSVIVQLFKDADAEPEYDILRLRAASLGVSQQSLALRLQELKLAPEGYFDSLKQHQERNKRPAAKKKGGSYVNTQLFSLGNTYSQSVVRAYRREHIGVVEASRLMQLAPIHFNRITTAFKQG